MGELRYVNGGKARETVVGEMSWSWTSMTMGECGGKTGAWHVQMRLCALARVHARDKVVAFT
jgi:hypothetical protein